MIQILDPDLSALATLRDLARRYCAVELVIADCGCHTVSLFVDGVKIMEEDKSMAIAVDSLIRKIEKEKP